MTASITQGRYRRRIHLVMLAFLIVGGLAPVTPFSAGRVDAQPLCLDGKV